MTQKRPARGALLRRVEKLEKELEMLHSKRDIDGEAWRNMARRCADAEVRIKWALSILQTGDLPDGVEQ